MDTDQNRYNRSLNSLKLFFTDNDSKVRLFFLLLAVFLWLLIKLSKERYTGTIEFPVRYINLPETQIQLINKLPSKIKVTLKAPGFNLLVYKFNCFHKIKVNIRDIKQTISSSNSYWLTNNNLAFIQNQFDDETHVLGINPDTIYFKFGKLISKKVPVIFNYQKNYSNAIAFYKKPIVSPDSVTISSTKEEVNKIDSICTEKITLNADKDSVHFRVPLQLIRSDIVNYSNKFVEVDIRYTQLIEGKVEVPVSVINLHDSLHITVFPKRVEVIFHVSIEEYKGINETDFNVYADYNELIRNQGLNYLKLSVDSHPESVNYLSFEPKQVEFVITKK